MKIVTLSCAILVTLSPPAPAASDLQQAAGDVCLCLERPHAKAKEMVAKLQHAQATGDMSQLTAAQGEMMGVVTESSRCFEGLSQKYPDIDRNDGLKDQVMAMADERCPNPAKQMFGTR